MSSEPSILDELLADSETEQPRIVHQLAHLSQILKLLGWASMVDSATLRPQVKMALTYCQARAARLDQLFPLRTATLTEINLINRLNPLLIQFWHVQIVGTLGAAYLERFKKVE